MIRTNGYIRIRGTSMNTYKTIPFPRMGFQEGLVYLCLIKRTMKARDLEKLLCIDYKIIRDPSEVRQRIRSLKRKGYVKIVKEETGKPGRPKYLTANLEPLRNYFKHVLSEKEFETVIDTIEALGNGLLDYLRIFEKNKEILAQTLKTFPLLLSNYLSFAGIVLEIASRGKEKDKKIVKEKVLEPWKYTVRIMYGETLLAKEVLRKIKKKWFKSRIPESFIKASFKVNKEKIEEIKRKYGVLELFMLELFQIIAHLHLSPIVLEK